MKALRKTIALLLTVMLVVGILPSLTAEAKEVTIPVPTIKVKTIKDGTAVKITIGKTKDAEGYEVYVCPEGGFYGEAQNVSSEFQRLPLVHKDGTKKRTVTIKSLSSGKVKIKVRSYNTSKYGSWITSDYSKEKTVTLTDAANGYKTNYDFSKVTKGDVIKFGAYEQDNDFTNGKEPIEWVVLEKTKKAVLVVSKYALDYLPYNKSRTSVTWETCTLRAWMNDKFYSSAFNKTEKGLIKTVTIENYDNPSYKTNGGEDTKDKVFLLSMFDMINTDYDFSYDYKTVDENRRCGATAYTLARAPYLSLSSSYKTKDGEEACRWWWLRSPGISEDTAARVYADGTVDYKGGRIVSGLDRYNYYVDLSEAVRPALWINLNP